MPTGQGGRRSEGRPCDGRVHVYRWRIDLTGVPSFEQGDLDARASGLVVAEKVWARAQSYINGG